ncbi:MAG: hypothetical protein JXB32_24170 [Deltaproteobacteria bacterium]|nr:hypothetical protein [Deltaproteobacteria bacterium]
MNGRLLAVFALLAAATLVVASAVAQDAGEVLPAAADAGTTADAEAPPDDHDAEPPAVSDAGTPPPEPDAGAPTVADAGVPPPEPDAGAPTVADAGRGEARRVIARRREAALVGGWVAATHDPSSSTVTVDDLVLGANGEWTRGQSRVGSDQGLLAPPEETSGTWFTEEGTLVLLDRGSAVDEVLRSAFLIDDRSEELTLEVGGGPVLYYRYR